jgi:hypothetical protein
VAQIGAKPGKNRQISEKSCENAQKLVEMWVLGLTLEGPKSHCNERRGLSNPHEYRRNVENWFKAFPEKAPLSALFEGRHAVTLAST